MTYYVLLLHVNGDSFTTLFADAEPDIPPRTGCFSTRLVSVDKESDILDAAINDLAQEWKTETLYNQSQVKLFETLCFEVEEYWRVPILKALYNKLPLWPIGHLLPFWIANKGSVFYSEE